MSNLKQNLQQQPEPSVSNLKQNLQKPSEPSVSNLKQNPQPPPEPSGSKKTETKRMLRTFDRLTPRYCDDNKKRKSTSNSAQEDSSAAKKAATQSSGGAKKEYSKLRTLVPALSEREDSTKVEIIEETIRYIDALHHQLAARGVSQETTEEQSTTQQPESNPESMYSLTKNSFSITKALKLI